MATGDAAAACCEAQGSVLCFARALALCYELVDSCKLAWYASLHTSRMHEVLKQCCLQNRHHICPSAHQHHQKQAEHANVNAQTESRQAYPIQDF